MEVVTHLISVIISQIHDQMIWYTLNLRMLRVNKKAGVTYGGQGRALQEVGICLEI